MINPDAQIKFLAKPTAERKPAGLKADNPGEKSPVSVPTETFAPSTAAQPEVNILGARTEAKSNASEAATTEAPRVVGSEARESSGTNPNCLYCPDDEAYQALLDKTDGAPGELDSSQTSPRYEETKTALWAVLKSFQTPPESPASDLKTFAADESNLALTADTPLKPEPSIDDLWVNMPLPKSMMKGRGSSVAGPHSSEIGNSPLHQKVRLGGYQAPILGGFNWSGSYLVSPKPGSVSDADIEVTKALVKALQSSHALRYPAGLQVVAGGT